MEAKRILFAFALMYAISLPAISQVVKYYVQLADKNNSPYAISQPGAFLSSRALERRKGQNIAILENDIPVNKLYIQQIEKIGVSILSKSRWLNGLVISTNDSTSFTKINNLPFVLYMKRIQGAFAKKGNDSKFNSEASLPFDKTSLISSELKVSSYNYGNAFNQVNMLQGVELHNKGFSGQGIVIALLDGGFTDANILPAFDSLRKNNQILGTWDFVSRDSAVSEDDVHGMHVLSCLGGNLPGQLIGTAPKAGYYLLRTEDANAEYIGEEYYWIAGAEYADSVGADIISASLGYNTFDDATQNHTYADLNGRITPVARGATIAARKGILVVVSAGNEGASSWKQIVSPADADSIITVAAVDESENRTYFSSIGPSADGRIKPTVAAQGKNVVVASLFGGVEMASGTSFACPLLAGMGACLWQSQRTTSNIGIYNLIKKSGNHYLNPDSLTGYGIPNFYKILSGIPLNISKHNNVVFSPNPFSESIHISYTSQNALHLFVDLADASGRLLKHSEKDILPVTFNEIDITDIAELNKGVYFLRLSDTNETHVYKLIKL